MSTIFLQNALNSFSIEAPAFHNPFLLDLLLTYNLWKMIHHTISSWNVR